MAAKFSPLIQTRSTEPPWSLPAAFSASTRDTTSAVSVTFTWRRSMPYRVADLPPDPADIVVDPGIAGPGVPVNHFAARGGRGVFPARRRQRQRRQAQESRRGDKRSSGASSSTRHSLFFGVAGSPVRRKQGRERIGAEPFGPDRGDGSGIEIIGHPVTLHDRPAPDRSDRPTSPRHCRRCASRPSRPRATGPAIWRTMSPTTAT